ncbi:MAG: beta-lactamase family protein, partial [Deltaproteobacteria bacterium]|nr:beta-lactamase family protein [Deltaproteobacteria bacterium]
MALFASGKKAREERGKIDGSLHPEYQEVADALRKQLEGYGGGAAVCVYHHGECVVDLWGGTRDLEEVEPWRRDTMSPSFSTTKGVASTLVHIMADRGLIDYDARVAKYWPEFAQAGKEEITVRHVLAHQSGLYHIRQMIDHADRMLDWEHMVEAIERSEPAHPPGARIGYHGLTYGYLVGEILQRVTGTPFPDLVQNEIVEPLGLDGMYIGAPEAVLDRAAQLHWPEPFEILKKLPIGSTLNHVGSIAGAASSAISRALGLVGLDIELTSLFDTLAPRGISTFDFGSPETLRASIPAGNGLFTARSLARMYAALAGGGEIDGVRLISTRTLRPALRHALEARLPRRCDHPRLPEQRLRPLRLRGQRGVGRSQPRSRGRDDREQ